MHEFVSLRAGRYAEQRCFRPLFAVAAAPAPAFVPEPVEVASEPVYPHIEAEIVEDAAAPSLPDGDVLEEFRPTAMQLLEGFVADFDRVRARAIEVFESSIERALDTLAREVLARELEIAPVDVAALVARVRGGLERDGGVILRVAPPLLDQVHGAGLTSDEQLEAGDLMIELDDGSIDYRMMTRLRYALASLRVRL